MNQSTCPGFPVFTNSQKTTGLKVCAFYAVLLSLALATVNGAFAQVSTINSAVISNREFNDVPGSALTTVSNYPSVISFNDQNVSAASGFANRHVWRFSSNAGASSYAFSNDDFFRVSMTLDLSATANSPRKEAGFLFDTIGGQGLFLVNTDAGEIVAFGGPLPFYSFAPSTFTAGTPITLGMTYFLDSNTGLRSIIYTANGVNSPIQAFSNLEQGIINGSTLGGYFQIVNDSANPLNGGTAAFSNITIVPEPSTLALTVLGGLPLLLLLRRRH